MAVPAENYKPSLKLYPNYLPEMVYPSNFKTLRADKWGKMYFCRHYWRISSCLSQEMIGLEECENEKWRVYFGPIQLGIIDLKRTHGFGQSYSIVRYDGKVGKNNVVIL